PFLVSKQSSATNAEPLDQRLVAGFVLPLDVIKERSALRDHFEQAAARMRVLHMRFEMFGEIGDSFGEDRDLHLRRTRIAGLYGIFLHERLLALDADRHRVFPFSLKPAPGSFRAIDALRRSAQL